MGALFDLGEVCDVHELSGFKFRRQPNLLSTRFGMNLPQTQCGMNFAFVMVDKY